MTEPARSNDPWNARAPLSEAMHATPVFVSLEESAYFSESEFHATFDGSPLTRVKYSGFLRNVAVAMGNSGLARFRPPLEHLAKHTDACVAEHAQWALNRLECG